MSTAPLTQHQHQRPNIPYSETPGYLLVTLDIRCSGKARAWLLTSSGATSTSEIGTLAFRHTWKKRPMVVMSAAPGKTYICFYSNKCKFCEYFLRELAKIAPLKTQFHFICVDPSAQRPAIPASITQVPAVIQRGEQVPMLGNDAINWLATMKLQMDRPAAPSGGQKPPNPAGMPEEPEAYFASDMGGRYSSAFTYIDNQGQELGGTIGNFEYLGGGGAGMSTTMASQLSGVSSEPVGGGKVSAKERMFNKQMEEYMSQREMGMPKPPVRQ